MKHITKLHPYEYHRARIEESGMLPDFHAVSSITRLARRYLRETRGWKYEICGNHLWNGQEIPLLVDHVDGDSTNRKLTNIRLICPNCDALLPTFKGRNRGKGRVERMNRYHSGKSF